MRRASATSVWWAVFIALAFLVLGFLHLSPARAQSTDPLEGQTAFIRGTDDDGGVATIGPIAVADCEADPNATASLTIDDEAGTRETFTDGENVELQFASDGITITDPEDGVLDVPDGFSPGTGTVVSSAGITCGAGGTRANENGGPDDTQYGNHDREITVIVKTIPDKPLPETGGFPLLLGAGVLIASAALLCVRILRP